MKDKAHRDFGGFPTFRYFRDYAGGAMTDWGVRLIDPMHQCFDEVMPKFLMSSESRTANPLAMFGYWRERGHDDSWHGGEAVCESQQVAMRTKTLIDWDEKNRTVKQDNVKPYLKARYRAPWKLVV